MVSLPTPLVFVIDSRATTGLGPGTGIRSVISDSHSDFMDQSPAKGSIRVNVSMRIKPLGCGTPAYFKLSS